jgi:hypothetical protein
MTRTMSQYPDSGNFPGSRYQGSSSSPVGYDQGRSTFDEYIKEEEVDPGGGNGKQAYRYQHQFEMPSYNRFGQEHRVSAGYAPTGQSWYGSSPVNQDARSYSGDRTALPSDHHNHYRYSDREPDIPSLVGSESSSLENSWSGIERQWDMKMPAKRLNSSSEPFLGKTPSVKSIEIKPGQYLRLRGADETWRAIELDFYMPGECMCCTLTIFCIQDADFVLCPECRVVSPMACTDFGECSEEGGVGLGFTWEDLARWQEDIERNRRVTRGRAKSYL